MQVFVFIYLGKMLGSSQRIFCPPSRSKAKIKLEGLTNTLRMEYGPLNTPGSCTKQGLGLGYRLALGGFGTKGLGTGLDISLENIYFQATIFHQIQVPMNPNFLHITSLHNFCCPRCYTL